MADEERTFRPRFNRRIFPAEQFIAANSMYMAASIVRPDRRIDAFKRFSCGSREGRALTQFVGSPVVIIGYFRVELSAFYSLLLL